MITKKTVERLGHLGDGIAPGPVFVPGALPGEGDRIAEGQYDCVCAEFQSAGGTRNDREQGHRLERGHP